jgi:hypothetical protein
MSQSSYSTFFAQPKYDIGHHQPIGYGSQQNQSMAENHLLKSSEPSTLDLSYYPKNYQNLFQQIPPSHEIRSQSPQHSNPSQSQSLPPIHVDTSFNQPLGNTDTYLTTSAPVHLPSYTHSPSYTKNNLDYNQISNHMKHSHMHRMQYPVDIKEPIINVLRSIHTQENGPSIHSTPKLYMQTHYQDNNTTYLNDFSTTTTTTTTTSKKFNLTPIISSFKNKESSLRRSKSSKSSSTTTPSSTGHRVRFSQDIKPEPLVVLAHQQQHHNHHHHHHIYQQPQQYQTKFNKPIDTEPNAFPYNPLTQQPPQSQSNHSFKPTSKSSVRGQFF